MAIGNIFAGPTHHDTEKEIQKGEVLVCILSMFYWTVKKEHHGMPCMHCRYFFP